ncbi:MAG: allophanate hydrolase [Solirubrobacteraceae bacterium]|nr:allophanate hydrolase [Solirubrobacteraceae bacterium]
MTVWITQRPEAEIAAEIAAASGPLAGVRLAVKDNIDVAGLPTTAGCPAYAYTPAVSAPCVQRLVDAGAVVVGKTNLDQFATGLVGTRSPYGAVHDARRPDYISGGSSSGSAVAVALGMADLALGTDTAGSGRVPAAFAGIVGVKPTRGLVPLTGVVPACRTLDVVTTMARDLALAELAAGIMAGDDGDDPRCRAWPAGAPLAAPPAPRVGMPLPEQLDALTPAAREAFARAAASLDAEPVDVSPILDAGALLYGGAFVAERHAAVGEFVCAHRPAVDPVVAAIIGASGDVSATDLVADGERLDAYRLATARLFAAFDALLLPTTVAQPTLEAVAGDPIGANAALGRYVNGCNLLDLCAVAVPAGEADGGCFGAMVYAPAFHDRVAADVAARVTGEPPSARGLGPAGIDLLVVGAHLSGQPLNHQLTDRGARLVGPVRTAPSYRLYALDTEPPKPGLVRAATGGAAIAGELWRLPPAGLASLLAELPSPMLLGRVTLEDGSEVVGFACEGLALQGAEDITAFGGWLTATAR